MRIPLQYQIMIPLVVVAGASLVAVGAINARRATQETQATIDRQLQGVVRVLTSSNFPLTDAVLRHMKDLSGAEFVLISQEGLPVSKSISLGSAQLPSTPLADKTEEVVLGPQIALGDKAYFHTAVELKRPLGVSDSGVLHVLFPREQYEAAWRSSFLPPLVVGLITVLAVAVVTQWIAQRISRTLARLGTGVQRLAGGEFKPLELPERDDEVRDLAIAVNQTAARLSEYEQHVRQTEQVRTVAMLGAGLAHEMRNAATGCRLAVDLHAENCSLSASDDSLAVAKSQLQLMESRLQSFLQLGREDTTTIKQSIQLDALLDELIPLVLPAARHAGVALDWQSIDQTITVLANRELLSMVIVNLLLNAIEATRKLSHTNSAQVHVRLGVRGSKWAELEVNDTGAGLPTAVAEKLFQPFVSTKAEGVGLGLAVGQQVAQAHGGEIAWSRTNHQTSFRLRLPLARASEERNGTDVENSRRG